jgi:hypothetical protein
VRLRSLYLSMLEVQLPGETNTYSVANSTRVTRRPLLTGSSSSNPTGSVGSAAAAVLPQLQELTLRRCQLSMQLLSQLLSATALTKLNWSRARVCHTTGSNGIDTWKGEQKQEHAYKTLWQQLQLLPNLSVLILQMDSLTAAGIHPLATCSACDACMYTVVYACWRTGHVMTVQGPASCWQRCSTSPSCSS